jgi:hypothetical protein
MTPVVEEGACDVVVAEVGAEVAAGSPSPAQAATASIMVAGKAMR